MPDVKSFRLGAQDKILRSFASMTGFVVFAMFAVLREMALFMASKF